MSSLTGALTNTNSQQSNSNKSCTITNNLQSLNQQFTNNLIATSNSVTSTNNKQLLNNSTIKIVQRLLDEASHTGDLLLNNRNLNEYPSKLASNFDLSDTLTADLSKNHLTEFPKEICSFDSLEKLSLYSNLIRTIPEITIYQLKCLKYLDLNSNNLTYLPPCLCNLSSLEVLTINNNKLVSLPEEIGRLEKLIQLDVSCNEITHLPVQIGDMGSLRALNVRRNLLVELPKEISQLKLVSFDCSSNRLSKLPLCFREMVTLIDLVVDHNPLEVPPAHVCTKGLLHIMKYLLNEAIKEEKKRGILTEYEINTQFNNFNYNLSAHHQRLSCTTGLGYMVRNSMAKKFGSSSVPSSSMSTVSTSSSTSSSSSVSSSSLNSQISTPVFNSNPKKHSLVDLPSQTSSSGSSVNTPTNNQYFPNQVNSLVDNFPMLNINQNYKMSEMEGSDFIEGQMTSSPSSTKSSSASSTCSTSSNNSNQIPVKSSIKTQKIQETPNSKVVSIHELISLKSPNSQFHQSSQSFVKINRTISNTESSLMINLNDEDNLEHTQHEQNENKQVWLSKTSNKVTTGLAKRLITTNNNDNYDLLANANSSLPQKNILIDCSKYKKPELKMTSTQKMFLQNDFIDDPIAQEMTPYLIETQNDKFMDMESYGVSIDEEKYKSFNSQQQQQVWIPRDDLLSNTDNSENSAFTMRRHFFQIQEEQKQIEMLKKTIEQRLKIQLPNTVDELGIALSDGVVLCHLINQIFPRAVQIIHVPSLAMPKLSLAKCRKNVENFIDACRRIGLPENDLCCAHDIIEAKNTSRVARTVILLVGYNQYLNQQQQQQQIHQESLIYNSNNRHTTIGNIMNHNTNGMQQAQHSQQQTAV